MPSRSADGKLYFKIVFWGAPLSGKAKAVKWLFKREGFAEGKMKSIVDPTGRTLFFDRMVAGIANVKLQIYTVAGQRRHKFQRKTILNGVDGIIFVWDAQIAQWDENVWSLEELLEHLNGALGKSIPFIIMLSKQDLPNIIKRKQLIKFLESKGLDTVISPMTGDEVKVSIYDTIIEQGLNVKRAFQHLARDAVLNYYNKIRTTPKHVLPEKEVTDKKIEVIKSKKESLLADLKASEDKAQVLSIMNDLLLIRDIDVINCFIERLNLELSQILESDRDVRYQLVKEIAGYDDECVIPILEYVSIHEEIPEIQRLASEMYVEKTEKYCSEEEKSIILIADRCFLIEWDIKKIGDFDETIFTHRLKPNKWYLLFIGPVLSKFRTNIDHYLELDISESQDFITDTSIPNLLATPFQEVKKHFKNYFIRGIKTAKNRSVRNKPFMPRIKSKERTIKIALYNDPSFLQDVIDMPAVELGRDLKDVFLSALVKTVELGANLI